MTILLPIFLSVTIGQRKKKNKWIFFYVLTAVFHPIFLHFQLIVAKSVRTKIILNKNRLLASNFKENIELIKELEDQICQHRQLQQGLESIYQLSIFALLSSYAYSKTRTFHGLAALFEVNISIIGISLPSDAAMFGLLLLSIGSFILANINGIRGNFYYFPIMSKLILAISVLCACLAKVMSTTLYFSPILGLLDLLFHYKGTYIKTTQEFKQNSNKLHPHRFIAEMFGFISLDPVATLQQSYDGRWIFDNATLSQIQRGSHSYVIGPIFDPVDEWSPIEFSRYVPPPLELYTYFSQRTYFWSFWCLQFAQIAMIFLVNKLWLEKNCITLWEGVLAAPYLVGVLGVPEHPRNLGVHKRGEA